MNKPFLYLKMIGENYCPASVSSSTGMEVEAVSNSAEAIFDHVAVHTETHAE